jgi:hypothetical protein
MVSLQHEQSEVLYEKLLSRFYAVEAQMRILKLRLERLDGRIHRSNSRRIRRWEAVPAEDSMCE